LPVNAAAAFMFTRPPGRRHRDGNAASEKGSVKTKHEHEKAA
jgi:hypothetical protein